jgi:dTMP kinase
MFVSFEGVDGSGKSTQAGLLAERLRSEGREVVLTREPGGTAAGEQIRELLLHGAELAPWTEASLFAAARAQLVDEVIRPALARGVDVVCDRYLDSSLAEHASHTTAEQLLHVFLPYPNTFLEQRAHDDIKPSLANR